MTTKEEIGRRVRSRREELELTQQELADRVGYKTKGAINREFTSNTNKQRQTEAHKARHINGLDVIRKTNKGKQKLIKINRKLDTIWT